ncbi:cytochrome c [Draconibacterium sp.]|uniref:c-type cytochrome n=1 Tax=Draconibacterium sp. TaxID=1965318 RepID=UPI0026014ECD|nr:cytochrome c [uncultured Draconibacterium sp.]
MKLITSLNHKKVSVTIYLVVLLFVFSNAVAQDGEKLFQQCRACHTIGGGKLLGPDLLDVSKRRDVSWIKNFIKSSQRMIKAGDPDAVALFEEFNKLPMMDYNFSDPELDALVKYIDSFSTNESEKENEEHALSDSTAAAQATEYLASIYTEENLIKGQELFEGKRAFKNGGPSCISCHHVNSDNAVQGGLLAADLTKSFSRNGGLAGIKGIIDHPPFPAMKNAYEEAVLTKDESVKIQVYLMHADKADVMVEAAPTDFIKNGVKGMFILLVLIALVWFKRKKRSVNYQIMKRQSKFH